MAKDITSYTNAKGNTNNVNILCTEMHIKNQTEILNDSFPSTGHG